MRITKLRLKNFKRFTDLNVDSIPPEAKLVLLIGSNGSGKSSIFDAFNSLSKTFNSAYPHESYYLKNGLRSEIHVHFDNGDFLSSNDYGRDLQAGKRIRFIGRSSIRIVPRISAEGNPDIINDNLDEPATFIDQDGRFNNDVSMYVQQIDNALREPTFSGKSADTVKIFQDFIQPFNNSLLSIFGGDSTTTIQLAEYHNATRQTNGSLIFRKGNSKINYDLLSHGEKQVVILLLNFIVRAEQFQNAIIYIDEMDCHLNTSLQSRLLSEIVNVWIPNTAQLWTASHALGFIDFARKSENACILDFDQLNFDFPQTITPQTKDRLDVYEIAIPKTILFDILKGKRLIICENQNDEYYNLLQIPDTVFVGVKDSRELFLNVKRDQRYQSLRDRDFLSGSEIKKICSTYPNHHILRYYDFENYLYHPENIDQLGIKSFDKKSYIQEITRQKNDKIHYILATLTSSRQNYEEFKTDPKLKDKDLNEIIEDFKSNDFEKFYQYFDMKDQFNGAILAPFNLSKEHLVKTDWFRDQITACLNINA